MRRPSFPAGRRMAANTSDPTSFRPALGTRGTSRSPGAMTAPKIAVAGATGLIGTLLIAELQARKVPVVPIARSLGMDLLSEDSPQGGAPSLAETQLAGLLRGQTRARGSGLRERRSLFDPALSAVVRVRRQHSERIRQRPLRAGSDVADSSRCRENCGPKTGRPRLGRASRH